MSEPPLARIKQHLYRQSLAIFGSAALALLLAAALWLGVQNVLDHERANLAADFSASVAYIAEQEQFLRKVQAQTRRGAFLRGGLTRATGDAAPSASVIVRSDDPASAPPVATQLATQLSDYYTLFWAYSHFPSASLVAFDAADTVRLTIPALTRTAAQPGSGEVNDALLGTIVAAAKPHITAAGLDGDANDVHWLALPSHPRRMVGLLPAQWENKNSPLKNTPLSRQAGEGPGERVSTPILWLATLMSRARLQGDADTTVLDKHQFWLANLRQDQILLGTPDMPALSDGFNLTADGLALCLRQAPWRGCYRIGYGSFFEDKLWLPAVALLVVLLGVAGVRGYLRWFQRQVIDPAQRTQAQLAAANEAKSTFLATMSHEIRTPLYGVLGTLELLARTRLDEEQQQYVARMQGAASLLQQQISDVLDLRTIEAGKMTLNLAPFSLRELVQTTADAYADMASRKGLTLACHIAPGVPEYVQGDAARLRQILANLLSNAVKFTESGGVTVRLEAATAAPCTVHLQVADTGAGITPEHLATLFTPFQTAHNPGGIRGAGLGLSICQHLAQLMASRIEVESEVGVGSRFSLQLALPPAPAPAAKPHAKSPDAGGCEALGLQLGLRLGLRLLVAEDNPINQATLQNQLQQLGCAVTLAADGQAALACWQDHAFDALLTDVNMPNLDGYALARALRARGVTQPIIGVSANALPDEDARCRAAGMTARLVKPVSLDALHRALREHCPSASTTPDVQKTIPEKYRAVFHATMQADLHKWRAHLATGNAAQLAQTLHRIRGGLAAVGQTTLVNSLAAMEDALQHGLTDAIRTRLRSAETALQRLIDDTADTAAADA